jgi:hypothetical protein
MHGTADQFQNIVACDETRAMTGSNSNGNCSAVGDATKDDQRVKSISEYAIHFLAQFVGS